MSDNVGQILIKQDATETFYTQTATTILILQGVLKAKIAAGIAPADSAFNAIETSDINNTKQLQECLLARRYVPYLSSLYQWVYNPSNGAAVFGQNVEFQVRAASAKFTGITFAYVEFEGVGDPNGDIYYNYCTMPGVKLIKQARFTINGQAKEQYGYINVLDIFEHEMSNDVKTQFLKCVGEQEATAARLYNEDVQADMYYPIVDGPQTMKKYQPPLIMVIPLFFSFCQDPNMPLNNDQSSDKNRSIQLLLAEPNELIRSETTAGVPLDVPNGTLKIKQFYLFSKATYLNPELSDLFNTDAKQVIRNYRTFERPINIGGANTLDLKQIEYPIERIYLRFTPQENYDDSLVVNRAFSFRHWTNPMFLTPKAVNIVFAKENIPPPPVIVIRKAEYFTEALPVTTINLKLNETLFYTSFVPAQVLSYYNGFYTNKSLTGPAHAGAFAINFAEGDQYAYGLSVNGYIDFTYIGSRILSWDSQLISTIKPVKLEITYRYLNMRWCLPGSMDYQYLLGI